LKVVNDTNERLCIVLKYRAWTKERGWQWYGPKQYEFAPGQADYLADGWKVRASAIRFRAWTPTRKWDRSGSDYPLVPTDGYRKGADLGTFDLSFG
jgi:hypothetical protein